MMSKIFSSIGHEGAGEEKEALQKIFSTIDTDGTGSCSIEELTVSNISMLVLWGRHFLFGQQDGFNRNILGRSF
jgi:hypothetical protein